MGNNVMGMGQNEFLQAIEDLERLGKSNSDHLRMSTINEYFSDLKLESGQLDSICRYLRSHDIIIDEWIPETGNKLDEAAETEEITTHEDPLDQSMVDIYLKETDGTKHLTEDQEEMLARKLICGDENARNLLIEANLDFAVKLAGEYKGHGLQMSDLIQEANIGLMIAVNDYEPGLHRGFHHYAEEKIREYLEEKIEEYNGSTRSAIKMANRVNELNDIATAFAREYEREAKASELAERMGISEEEVRELMKVSLDAIAVLDQGKM